MLCVQPILLTADVHFLEMLRELACQFLLLAIVVLFVLVAIVFKVDSGAEFAVIA